ncbi:hypothetical protein A3Q56_06641 [Intoshia linei]|uniref:Uncharacterized protein n=1 Tax=Intoshia linei TaxID=1819745 RepID=A0A177AUH6_9BILA|nr:hypothetical protein A3Q56_06641 [Intoshia linei]
MRMLKDSKTSKTIQSSLTNINSNVSIVSNSKMNKLKNMHVKNSKTGTMSSGVGTSVNSTCTNLQENSNVKNTKLLSQTHDISLIAKIDSLNLDVTNKCEQISAKLSKKIVRVAPESRLSLADKKKMEWKNQQTDYNWDPWGKPGGGAPLIDPYGNLLSDYNVRKSEILDKKYDFNKINLENFRDIKKQEWLKDLAIQRTEQLDKREKELQQIKLDKQVQFVNATVSESPNVVINFAQSDRSDYMPQCTTNNVTSTISHIPDPCNEKEDLLDLLKLQDMINSMVSKYQVDKPYENGALQKLQNNIQGLRDWNCIQRQDVSMVDQSVQVQTLKPQSNLSYLKKNKCKPRWNAVKTKPDIKIKQSDRDMLYNIKKKQWRVQQFRDRKNKSVQKTQNLQCKYVESDEKMNNKPYISNNSKKVSNTQNIGKMYCKPKKINVNLIKSKRISSVGRLETPFKADRCDLSKRTTSPPVPALRSQVKLSNLDNFMDKNLMNSIKSTNISNCIIKPPFVNILRSDDFIDCSEANKNIIRLPIIKNKFDVVNEDVETLEIPHIHKKTRHIHNFDNSNVCYNPLDRKQPNDLLLKQIRTIKKSFKLIKTDSSLILQNINTH